MVTCEVKPDRAALEALVNDLMSKGHMEIAEQGGYLSLEPSHFLCTDSQVHPVMNEILGPNGALPGFGSDGARA